MSSTITNYSNAINVNYPIPGQDNDSQGFRTNFSKIQSALNVAGGEITELQVNSVKLNDTNDFGNNIVKKAAFINCSDIAYTGEVSDGVISVDLNSGGYQRFTIDTAGTYSINILGDSYPPSGYCGTVRLEINRTVSNITLDFIGENTVLTGKTNSTIAYASSGTCVWDVWTPDEGTTLIANELAGNKEINVTATGNIYPTGTPSVTMTDGFFYIPSAAGVPTGIPTAITGFAPMYLNTLTSDLYIFNGVWKKVTLS